MQRLIIYIIPITINKTADSIKFEIKGDKVRVQASLNIKLATMAK
jgi:hypothetical protein